MTNESARRFLGDRGRLFDADAHNSAASELARVLDAFAQERDRIAPVRDPRDLRAVMDVKWLSGPTDQLIHGVNLTADDVAELRRRILGQ